MPRVAILMCTRDGAAHLPAQLASLAAQTHADWELWVSDDGSRDGTRDLLARFGQAHPVRVVDGPRRGAAANFVHLATRPELPEGRPVAFADQDDVWRPDKLARGLARLAATANGRPALYAARVAVVDDGGRRLGRTPPPPPGLGLGDLLAWNPAGGHTTILDPDAAALVRAAGRVEVPHHDWWFALLVAAAGGRLELEDAEVLDYRQHGANAMGAAAGAAARLSRLRGLLDGSLGRWIDANARALLACGAPLTPRARAAAEDLLGADGPHGRLAAFRRHGLRRRTRAETAALYLAAAAGRA